MGTETTNDLIRIEAGKTVTEFLGDINDNFETLLTKQYGQSEELSNKQNRIFVGKVPTEGTTEIIKDDGSKIIISSNGIPTGGNSGDILIIYEE